MLRKGQNSSFNNRQLVIFHREKSKSYYEIAQLEPSQRGKRYKEEDRIAVKKQKETNRIFNEEVVRRIIWRVKENSHCSETQLASEICHGTRKKSQC